MAIRRQIFWASIVLLVGALVFFGVGFLTGAFENTPLTLVGCVLTIVGLALTAAANRAQLG